MSRLLPNLLSSARLVRASLSLAVCLCMPQPVHYSPCESICLVAQSPSNANNHDILVFSRLRTEITSSSSPSILQPFCFVCYYTITALIYHTVTIPAAKLLIATMKTAPSVYKSVHFSILMLISDFDQFRHSTVGTMLN